MFSGIIVWFRETYVEDGRYRAALLEDIILIVSMAVGSYRIMSLDWNPGSGFFDRDITKVTLLLVSAVMLAYHVLWRLLEARRSMHNELLKESLKEQFPRFIAALSLLTGLYNFSTNVPVFISSLVMFYLSLNVWHLTVSKNMRRLRGTVVFDFFGLCCATAFASIAQDLYVDSQIFFDVTLPRYANDSQSASVVLAVFGGRQTNSVYAMGIFAGAMAANAFLAFISGNRPISEL